MPSSAIWSPCGNTLTNLSCFSVCVTWAERTCYLLQVYLKQTLYWKEQSKVFNLSSIRYQQERFLTGIIPLWFGCTVGLTRFHISMGSESSALESSPRGRWIVLYFAEEIPFPFTSRMSPLKFEYVSPLHSSLPRSFMNFIMLGWYGSKLGRRQAELSFPTRLTYFIRPNQVSLML